MTNTAEVPERRVDCFACKHFLVTYQPQWPYACRSFNIRSKSLPSIQILRTTGSLCNGFDPKPNHPRNRPPEQSRPR